MDCKTQVHVLKHPSEEKAAKGTVRLLQLLLPNMKVYVGEAARDFDNLKRQVDVESEKWALVYPSDNAKDVQHYQRKPPQHLIVVDGTWKKVYRILQLNPWLTDIPAVTFPLQRKSLYRIRKAPIANSFSTLEAVAMCLEAWEGIAIEPFSVLLEARMASFDEYQK